MVESAVTTAATPPDAPTRKGSHSKKGAAMSGQLKLRLPHPFWFDILGLLNSMPLLTFDIDHASPSSTFRRQAGTWCITLVGLWQWWSLQSGGAAMVGQE
jgi:hypothetical protein